MALLIWLCETGFNAIPAAPTMSGIRSRAHDRAVIQHFMDAIPVATAMSLVPPVNIRLVHGPQQAADLYFTEYELQTGAFSHHVAVGMSPWRVRIHTQVPLPEGRAGRKLVESLDAILFWGANLQWLTLSPDEPRSFAQGSVYRIYITKIIEADLLSGDGDFASYEKEAAMLLKGVVHLAESAGVALCVSPIMN